MVSFQGCARVPSGWAGVLMVALEGCFRRSTAKNTHPAAMSHCDIFERFVQQTNVVRSRFMQGPSAPAFACLPGDLLRQAGSKPPWTGVQLALPVFLAWRRQSG